MSKRILELKHQASLWCDENIPEQFSEETNGYGKAWEDKFAELIIKDVMNEVFVVYAGGKKGIDVEFQNITPRQWINHVFGVKEYNTEGTI